MDYLGQGGEESKEKKIALGKVKMVGQSFPLNWFGWSPPTP